MARAQIRTDAGAVLATRDIPDAAIPHIQNVFGGVTNAETSALALDFMLLALRRHVRLEEARLARVVQEPAVTNAGIAAEAALDGDWP